MMRTVFVAALAARVALPGAAAFTQEPDLGWLAGHWRSEREGRIFEEYWTTPAGGTLLAVNRTVIGEETRAFEYMRIVLGENGALYAQPSGGPPTRFALIEASGTSVAFENPDHDYPQRIVYAREGERLSATISLIDGTEARVFSWTRAGGAP